MKVGVIASVGLVLAQQLLDGAVALWALVALGGGQGREGGVQRGVYDRDSFGPATAAGEEGAIRVNAKPAAQAPQHFDGVTAHSLSPVAPLRPGTRLPVARVHQVGNTG